MRVGCGVYAHTVRAKQYVYFWHYANRGAWRVRGREDLAPVGSPRTRTDAAQRRVTPFGRGGESHDPPPREFHRWCEGFRAAPYPLHPSGRVVRPGVHLGTEERPLLAAHSRLPAGGALRIPRRDLEGEQLDPEQPPLPDQRAALLQRRRGAPVPPRDVDGRLRGTPAGRGLVRPVR